MYRKMRLQETGTEMKQSAKDIIVNIDMQSKD